MIRMVHEEHGYHIAYTAQEEEALKASGWRPDPTWGVAIPAKAANEPVTEVKRKPGRPAKAA